MKVTCHYRNDPERPLDDPTLAKGERRFAIRIYSGDICDPVQIGGGNWFTPPYPKRVWRTYCSLPILPFIMWKWPFLDRTGYIGFKLYGADSPEYKKWGVGFKPEDVYEGSQALCLSFRPFARQKG